MFLLWEMWPICHCLGLNHETVVCAVCLPIFLWVYDYSILHHNVQKYQIQSDALVTWLNITWVCTNKIPYWWDIVRFWWKSTMLLWHWICMYLIKSSWSDCILLLEHMCQVVWVFLRDGNSFPVMTSDPFSELYAVIAELPPDISSCD